MISIPRYHAEKMSMKAKIGATTKHYETKLVEYVQAVDKLGVLA